MTQNKGTIEIDHSPPCDNLTGFRKIITWVIGFQATFTLALLTVCVTIMSNQAVANERITANHAAANEKILKIATRQDSIEEKADQAASDASKALVISGKAEANIAWIREGMTEMKMMFRNRGYQQAQPRPTTPTAPRQ